MDYYKARIEIPISQQNKLIHPMNLLCSYANEDLYVTECHELNNAWTYSQATLERDIKKSKLSLVGNWNRCGVYIKDAKIK